MASQHKRWLQNVRWALIRRHVSYLGFVKSLEKTWWRISYFLNLVLLIPLNKWACGGV
jgi:hypothetical protein